MNNQTDKYNVLQVLTAARLKQEKELSNNIKTMGEKATTVEKQINLLKIEE